MRNLKFKIQNSKFFKLLLIVYFISTFSSCTKDEIKIENKSIENKDILGKLDVGNVNTYEPTIFAVYTIAETSQPFNTKAKLRIGGNLTTLSTLNSGAYCVSVSSNGDVYVGGYENTTNYSKEGSKIWKNGQNYFTQPSGGIVKVLVTNGNDLYYILNNKVYKNNLLLYTLTSEGSAIVGNNASCNGRGIYVYGSDIYICGMAGFFEAVVIWKNGILINESANVPNPVSNGLGGYYSFGCDSIYVDATGFYVAGYRDSKASIWKNGIHIELPLDPVPLLTTDHSFANSITGDGINVYATGSQYNSQNGGKLWKMNKSTNVVNIERNYYGQRTSVFNYQGDIYTSGFEKIWKNLELKYTDLGQFSNSIYVK